MKRSCHAIMLNINDSVGSSPATTANFRLSDTLDVEALMSVDDKCVDSLDYIQVIYKGLDT